MNSPTPRTYTIKISSQMAAHAKDWQPIRELGDWYRIETHDDGTADMIFLRGTSHPATMLDQRRAELSQRLTQRALQPDFNWAHHEEEKRRHTHKWVGEIGGPAHCEQCGERLTFAAADANTTTE